MVFGGTYDKDINTIGHSGKPLVKLDEGEYTVYIELLTRDGVTIGLAQRKFISSELAGKTVNVLVYAADEGGNSVGKQMVLKLIVSQ